LSAATHRRNCRQADYADKKDYLQNDLQQNDYKKNFIDRIIFMTESFEEGIILMTESF